MPAKTYTKQSLITELIKIRDFGWHRLHRNKKNAGSIGNTLEDLLGIKENNLPLPNAAEWELKTQRIKTNSLITLFHMEPSPRALKIVSYLLQNYGWKHDKAGKKYPDTEKSFRQTLTYDIITPRGFSVGIEDDKKRIIINFDFNAISDKYAAWKNELIKLCNIKLYPEYIPYWGYNDLFHKAGVKLKNCFLVLADEKKENGEFWVKFDTVMMLSNFQLNKMLDALRLQQLYIDFDARTGHNHGTKFRIKHDFFPKLYEEVVIL